MAHAQGRCFLVQPTGGKRCRVRYRLSGKESAYSIGRYPEVTLAQARAERDRVRSQSHSGLDAVHQRSMQKVASDLASDNRFGKLAARWFDVRSGGRSKRHAGYVWGRP